MAQSPQNPMSVTNTEMFYFVLPSIGGMSDNNHKVRLAQWKWYLEQLYGTKLADEDVFASQTIPGPVLAKAMSEGFTLEKARERCNQ